MRPVVFRMADRVVDRIANRAMRPLRQELGLPPARSVLGSWWRSPDGAIGLFPYWFAPPVSRTIDPLPLFGFPLLDDHPAEDSSEKLRLEGWLAAAPRRPIVFAPGSANEQASEYFRMAIEAARRLGRPALLLSSNPKANLPAKLPDHVAASTYLPLSWLLPRCEGLVHHGGVGTTSQAFATGTPQTIVAMAFDQFDNGIRVESLGCGNWLPRRKATVDRLVDAIGKWERDACRPRALELASQMSDDPMVSERSLRYSIHLRRAAEFLLVDGDRKGIA
jgi:UDP:flavonoid glycosyltransferase YjiC (YdhE family)